MEIDLALMTGDNSARRSRLPCERDKRGHAPTKTAPKQVNPPSGGLETWMEALGTIKTPPDGFLFGLTLKILV
jgi:hypothetical protein